MAETKEDANIAFDLFLEKYEKKYSSATSCLAKDRNELLAFYDFPAEHWKQSQVSNFLTAWRPSRVMLWLLERLFLRGTTSPNVVDFGEYELDLGGFKEHAREPMFFSFDGVRLALTLYL